MGSRFMYGIHARVLQSSFLFFLDHGGVFALGGLGFGLLSLLLKVLQSHLDEELGISHGLRPRSDNRRKSDASLHAGCECEDAGIDI